MKVEDLSLPELTTMKIHCRDARESLLGAMDTAGAERRDSDDFEEGSIEHRLFSALEEVEDVKEEVEEERSS